MDQFINDYQPLSQEKLSNVRGGGAVDSIAGMVSTYVSPMVDHASPLGLFNKWMEYIGYPAMRGMVVPGQTISA
ncbi:hypothetical protein [Schleiferilactobacillus shenzhenensis]|nr:hypothetical protein [Schleiferilactobacillus shenzhenensis]